MTLERAREQTTDSAKPHKVRSKNNTECIDLVGERGWRK